MNKRPTKCKVCKEEMVNINIIGRTRIYCSKTCTMRKYRRSKKGKAANKRYYLKRKEKMVA